MASFQSKHLAGVAKVRAAVCKDCKKACEKHAACKARAESCEDCIKACEKIAA